MNAAERLRQLVLGAGGIDLALYKSRCLERRIALRQRAAGAPDLESYVALVGRDPAERRRLVQALTIHVSQFFRNPTTFQALRQQVLPAILAEKRQHGGRALRFWSVGCACGEEAYSLALLLLDAAPEALTQYSCAIYGTDIDAGCLRMAEQAVYPAGSLAHLPRAWRERYFTPAGGRWALLPAVRQLVTFRRHNVLDAPPVRRVDLLLFRNVLIYMTEPLQERLLCALHEVMTPGGFLVLGKVEGLPGPAARRFRPVNVPERIYRRAE
ncbi:MAG: protein-glutamate O-methyltransferase CheR [Candidatus Methylomirabilales bacterium]